MIKAAAIVDFFKAALADKWGYIWGKAGESWTQKKQDQLVQYMVNKYGTSWKKNSEAKADKRYNSASKGAKWIGHIVSDCSGMFVKAYEKLKGGKIPHGSNSIWKDSCSAKGKIVSGKKQNGEALLPGTAVFTGTEDDHPHIGLYVGGGKVIEASGVDAGVCTSNITANKWTWWGELKAVDYKGGGTADPEPATGNDMPTIRKGDKGEYVKKAQTLLKAMGYDLGPCGIDGDFGTATQKAVKAFQKDWGLKEDGIVGPQTWKYLTSAPIKENGTYSVVVSHLTQAQAKALAAMYEHAEIEKEVG